MAMILDLVLMSINMAWAPYFYRISSTEEDAPYTIARMTTYFAILMVAFGLLVALLSQDLIRIMADPAFWDAYQVVPVVVLAFIAHGFYFMFVNQLFFAKSTRRLALYTVLSAGLNIILNVLLLPSYGIMAAAWNTVIGYLLLTLLVFFESRRVYPIPYEYRRIILVLLAGLATYLITLQISSVNPILTILLRSLVMALFPALLFILGFFTPNEIKGIRSIPLRTKTWLASRKSDYDQPAPPSD
jgi:O-antigen/teichoic acid export membrane protein